VGSVPRPNQCSCRDADLGTNSSNNGGGLICCCCCANISGATARCVIEAVTILCVPAVGGNDVWLGVGTLSSRRLTNGRLPPKRTLPPASLSASDCLNVCGPWQSVGFLQTAKTDENTSLRIVACGTPRKAKLCLVVDTGFMVTSRLHHLLKSLVAMGRWLLGACGLRPMAAFFRAGLLVEVARPRTPRFGQSSSSWQCCQRNSLPAQ